MIRLTILLCGGIFLVLLIAGQDNGQVRQGLKMLPTVPQQPVAAVTPAPIVKPETQVTDAVFVPAQPVRVAPAAPKPSPAQSTVIEPAPQPQGSVGVVTVRSVNVRSGPSTSDAIIGRLSNGEEVLVVAEDSPVEGWSLVRIEGDGVEGYVASRLLQISAP